MLWDMDIPANWQWGREEIEPAKAAIFDLDGVLADANGRQHYLDRPIRDWDGFFEAVGGDLLLEDTARLLHVLGETLQVVLLTARPLFVRDVTVDWLNSHELSWDLLIMRDDGDRSPSSRFKQSSVAKLRNRGFDPIIGFEDDIRNVEMLRDEGIPCVYIHSGYYG